MLITTKAITSYKNMIQIIFSVHYCRDGTCTVQNKKINLSLLNSESWAKVH